MTSFSVTDIPASVNSLEKLLAWGSTVLNHLYPTVSYEESTGVSNRAAQVIPFEVTVTSTPEWHYITRTTLKLNRNWQQTGKIWEHATDIGSLGIPPAMKV